MYQNGCNAYRQSAGNMVEDSSVVLIKLYDGALRFLSLARRGIMEKKANVRGENISKVMAIVNELDCALDMEKGGELSIQLASLYRFAMDKLTAANQRNDLGALGEVENILGTLKEGFAAAAAKAKTDRETTVLPDKPTAAPQEGVRFAV